MPPNKGHAIAAIALLVSASLVCSSQAAADEPGYYQYDQKRDDIQVTGRIYHAAPGQVWIEVWPRPHRKNLKINKISLNSPTGQSYKPSDLQSVPLSQIGARRRRHFEESGYSQKKPDRLTRFVDWVMPTAFANCSPEHSGGGNEDDDRRDAEGFAAFGLLAGMAGETEKHWVTTGSMAVTEEPGQWSANVEVIDEKGKKHRFTVPFELMKIPTPGSFASSFDPETGITTSTFHRLDGVRVVRKTDQSGGVISEEEVSEKEVPAGEKAVSAGPMIEGKDPETGITTRVVKNPDGTRTVTLIGEDGTVISTVTKTPEDKKPVTRYDPKTGITVTVTEHEDGSVTSHAEDKKGNWVEWHYWPGGRRERKPPAPPPEPEPVPEPPPEKSTEVVPEPEPEPEPEPKPTGEEPPEPTPEPEPEPPGEEPVEQVIPIGVALMLSDRNWIPVYGDSVRVYAQIYDPDGTQPGRWVISSRQARVLVAFHEMSTEPGQALNEKLPTEPQTTPDLYFDQAQNPDFNCYGGPGKYSVFCESNNAASFHNVRIDSEDHGGYSSLYVQCIDTPCEVLRAEIKYLRLGDPPSQYAYSETDFEQQRVYVPRDERHMGERNHIADRWEEISLKHPPETEDEDNTPPGLDNERGDGLSAYEEYRGFFDNTDTHWRTSWRQKTLLVENNSGQSFAKFKLQSGIEVIEVKRDALKDRICNWLYKTAHLVDQHGILAISRALGGGRAVGGPGRPKVIQHVEAGATDNNALQHEMGHAVNMWHHGEAPWNEAAGGGYAKHWIYPQTNGILDWFRHIHPGNTLCRKRLPARFSIGEKGDQGSGDYDCLIRYARPRWKEVYPQASSYNYHCHEIGPNDETVFCNSLAGTRWNGGNNTAGNASKDKACLSQIAIKSNS